MTPLSGQTGSISRTPGWQAQALIRHALPQGAEHGTHQQDLEYRLAQAAALGLLLRKPGLNVRA